MSVPRVIAAFPGTGKTFAAGRDHRLVDSDSSRFSWGSPGVRNPNWPRNYMDHVRAEVASGAARVLTSTHAEVRAALAEAGIPYRLVCPAHGLCDEYRQRFVDRGSPESFVELVMANWDAWLEDCLRDTGADEHVTLGPGQYLTDVL